MKKILSVVLSITMLMSMMVGINFSALAAGEAALPASGTLDSDINWTFDGSTVTISGHGSDIPSYYSTSSDIDTNYVYNYNNLYGYSPFRGNSQIKSVVIKAGITGIGSGVFESCKGITSVSIPSTVKNIYSYAFAYDTALTNVTIPDDVDYVDDHAFYGAGLTSVTVTSNETSIRSKAFANNANLSTVNLPADLTAISTDAFDKTQIANTADANNILYIGTTLIGDIGHYAKDQNQVERKSHFVNNLTGTFAVREGTTAIANGALKGHTEITGISLPESLVAIGSSAFKGCNGVTSVTIPKNVETIGNEAFDFSYSTEDEKTGVTTEHKSQLASVNLLSTKVTAQSVVNLIDSMPEGSTLTAIASVNAASYCAKKKVNYAEHVHNVQPYQAAVAATFKKTGLTASTWCPDCGTIITAQKTTKKLGAAKLSKLTKGKKSFKATWKKVSSIGGYQIRYSTKKNMKGAKTKKVKGAKKTSVTIKKLKKNKKYYVQIRSYKKINGKTKYSKWSSKKTVTTK